MQSEPTEGAGKVVHNVPNSTRNPRGVQTMDKQTNNNQQTTAAALYVITAEQLQEVAQAAADKVAAKYEAERTDRLCTTKQAAEILQVDKTTIWRWSTYGIIHPQKIGGRNMYRYSELINAQNK